MSETRARQSGLEQPYATLSPHVRSVLAIQLNLAEALFIEIRTLIAYGLIALLVAGAIAIVLYLRHNSREAVERRRRHDRDQRAIHRENKA